MDNRYRGYNLCWLCRKRADLIIILKTNFICSTYRIVKCYIKNNCGGKEKSPHNPFKLAYLNYLDHKPDGKSSSHFKKLKSKYPKKVKIFSQNEKQEFLKNFSKD